MGGFGFDEIVLVILIAILAFGKDLPRVARKAGLFIKRARRYLLDIKEDIERQIPMEELDLQEDIDHAVNSPLRSDSKEPLPYIPSEDPEEDSEEDPGEWDSLEEDPEDSCPEEKNLEELAKSGEEGSEKTEEPESRPLDN